jgi:hypothetical protein
MMAAMFATRFLARAALAAAFAPSIAAAHAGHGSTPAASVAHYLLEVEHLVPGAILLVILAGAAVLRRSRRARSVRRR